jgi:NAD-dependent deacetylase
MLRAAYVKGPLTSGVGWKDGRESGEKSDVSIEEEIERAALLVSRAKRVVAFTGAGVSEESGIPTFRDPGGLWDRYDPYEMGSGDIFTSIFGGSGVPGGVMSFITEMIEVLEKARPNPGHLALGELEKMGILRSVITQNIDNLHAEAGNSTVIEVHGNVFRLACLNCGGKTLLPREDFFTLGRELERLLASADLAGIIRLASRCACSGVCRPDVVGFGEPVQDMPLAKREAKNCDLMLILGTSGAVYPAAYVPEYAKKAGARIIEINATACFFQELVDVGIIGKTGEILPRIVERVKELVS